jgi:hypothetical protein
VEIGCEMIFTTQDRWSHLSTTLRRGEKKEVPFVEEHLSKRSDHFLGTSRSLGTHSSDLRVGVYILLTIIIQIRTMHE